MTILSDALTYSRTLVAELSPSVLHEFGLSAALCCERFALTVTVQIETSEELQLIEDRPLMSGRTLELRIYAPCLDWPERFGGFLREVEQAEDPLTFAQLVDGACVSRTRWMSR